MPWVGLQCVIVAFQIPEHSRLFNWQQPFLNQGKDQEQTRYILPYEDGIMGNICVKVFCICRCLKGYSNFTTGGQLLQQSRTSYAILEVDRKGNNSVQLF